MRGFRPGSPRLLGGRERGVVGRAGRGLGLASCTAARGVRRRGLSVSWMQTETGYLCLLGSVFSGNQRQLLFLTHFLDLVAFTK